MTEIPTIRIKSENPLGYAIINQSDYNASMHELWEEPTEEDEKPEEPTESEETPTTDETEQPARKRRERKSDVGE